MRGAFDFSSDHREEVSRIRFTKPNRNETTSKMKTSAVKLQRFFVSNKRLLLKPA